jgi:hypothetical protein
MLVALSARLASSQEAEDPRPPQGDLPSSELNRAPKNDLLRELDGDGKSRQMVIRCGNSVTESVVSSALDWLDRHQMPDGSWSFDHTLCPGCCAKCRNPGELAKARNAATGLALLAYLGAGHTHQDGRHKEQVESGLDYLVEHIAVSPHGGSFMEGGGNMYSHGIAATALSEAYAMTADKKLMAPAQQAIDFVCYAQDPVGGGWRYSPRQKGDTSVTGWQLAALRSAHGCFLHVPAATVKKTVDFLDSVQADEGAAYGYVQPGHRPATTAIGLLCRLHLGWEKDNPALKRGVERLAAKGPSENNMYYNYYAHQLMFQVGGEAWLAWKNQMLDFLAESQATEAHEAGSWYFDGADHGARRGGRLYATTMAAIVLEVYYRHLPMFKKQTLAESWPWD